jgi:hypothetical protein
MLVNNMQQSLMVGFGSKHPSLFVGRSPFADKTGKIAIGNVVNQYGQMDPLTKLHLRADEGEIAAMFIEPQVWDDGTAPGGGGIDLGDKGDVVPNANGAYLFLGNESHGIEALNNRGVIFHTQSSYVFNDGAIKYGLNARAGMVLASIDAEGSATWVDPSTFSVWSLNRDNEAFRMSKVGVFTDTPETELDVIGTVKMSGFRLQNSEAQTGRVLSCRTTTGEAMWVDPANFSIWQVNERGEAYRMSKVGIGTDEPTNALDVNGNISVNDAIIGKVGPSKWVDPDFLTLLGSDDEQASKILIAKGNNTTHQAIKFISPAQGGEIQFFTGGVFNTIIRHNEFLIGKEDTPMELKVTGKIWAHEVEVKLDDWWDEVFDKDYNLMPLLQLEKFITDNNHLPDMPTEETVLKDGIELGEMNALLLKKVEELTLYVIELKKELEEVKRQQTSN